MRKPSTPGIRVIVAALVAIFAVPGIVWAASAQEESPSPGPQNGAPHSPDSPVPKTPPATAFEGTTAGGRAYKVTTFESTKGEICVDVQSGEYGGGSCGPSDASGATLEPQVLSIQGSMFVLTRVAPEVRRLEVTRPDKQGPVADGQIKTTGGGQAPLALTVLAGAATATAPNTAPVPPDVSIRAVAADGTVVAEKTVDTGTGPPEKQ